MSLTTLTQQLKAKHLEATRDTYLEVVGSTPHHPRCRGREAIDACWCERRYLVERAREAYRRACE